MRGIVGISRRPMIARGQVAIQSYLGQQHKPLLEAFVNLSYYTNINLMGV